MRFKRLFVACASVCLLAFTLSQSSPALAATLTVTSLADSGPGSLRDAIASAASGDTITFSVTGTITLTSGEMVIDKNLTIAGPGAGTLAVSGNSAFRVFEIDGPYVVVISDMTIENGAGSVAYGAPFPVAGGGAVYNQGTLTVNYITFRGNSTSGLSPGQPYLPFADGGAIFSDFGGTLMVNNCTFTNNVAQGEGGAISNGFYTFVSATLNVNNSTFSGNSARFGGGAIFNGCEVVAFCPTLTVSGSTFLGNFITSGSGGAINNQGAAVVTNSTFVDNRANTVSAILHEGSTLAVTNSTFSGNSASYVYANGVVTSFCFFPGCGATLKNTLLAGNTQQNCYGQAVVFVSQGHNLSDDGSCAGSFNQTGDMNNTPAGLDPNGLQSNGGPTQTIALLPTSPAVDAIPVSPTNYCTDVAGNPVTTDQRGIPRPQGPACDIGAFELVQTPAQLLSDLMNTVSGFNLPAGTANSLGAKLSAAQASVAANDITDACIQISSFISEVMAQSGKKLTVDQANQLIAQANAIKTALGCP